MISSMHLLFATWLTIGYSCGHILYIHQHSDVGSIWAHVRLTLLEILHWSNYKMMLQTQVFNQNLRFLSCLKYFYLKSMKHWVWVWVFDMILDLILPLEIVEGKEFFWEKWSFRHEIIGQMLKQTLKGLDLNLPSF